MNIAEVQDTEKQSTAHTCRGITEEHFAHLNLLEGTTAEHKAVRSRMRLAVCELINIIQIQRSIWLTPCSSWLVLGHSLTIDGKCIISSVDGCSNNIIEIVRHNNYKRTDYLKEESR